MNVIIDSAIPFIKGVLDPYADVSYIPSKDISSSNVRLCDILIIRTRTICNKKLLENSRVKLIATATIGCDHIDLDYCHQNGIEVISAQGCNASAVTQWVLASILELDKKEIITPAKSTIGIIGVGNVGSKVDCLLSKLGFNILKSDPPREFRDKSFKDVPLDYLLKNSDIITIHTPITYNGEFPTHNLISNREFSLIKKGSVIINASRGEVIDESALKTAIKNGTIADALLDVYCNEPNIDQSLIDLTTIATPHIAGYSINGKANGSSMIIRAIAKKIGIQPLTNWYPKDVEDVIYNTEISFSSLKRLMPLFYNISQDSKSLKENIRKFEELRNNYNYREEFF